MQNPSNIDFLGPARKTFDSFDQQAEYYLDTFCGGWRCPIKPRTHLIPCIYRFTRPELSDSDVHNLSFGNIIIGGRHGDEEECFTHRAIQNIAIQGISAPFLAIANLNLNDKRRALLQSIFAHLILEGFMWPALELDFLLIGPKIGVIIIEVKGFQYDPEGHFRIGVDTILPKEFNKGLTQLHNFEKFLHSCERFIQAPQIQSEKIRKILFLPNVSRKPFEDWRNSSQLRDKTKQIISEKIGNVCLIFGKEGFLENLSQILENSTHFQIPQDIYEAYTKFLTGIGTMMGTKTSIKLHESDFNKSAAIKLEYLRIKSQNPNMKELPKMEENGKNPVKEEPNVDHQVIDRPEMAQNSNISIDQGDQLDKSIRNDPKISKDRKKSRKPGGNSKNPVKHPKNEGRCAGNVELENSEMIAKNTTDQADQIGENANRSTILTDKADQIADNQTKSAENPQNQEKSVCSLVPVEKIVRMQKILEKISIVLLTPEQQSILEGENHQILIGVAGTGKTILLQAKGLELLEKGESIRVIAPLNLRLEYKSFFALYGHKNVPFYDWRMWIDLLKSQIDSCTGGLIFGMAQRIIDCARNGMIPEDNFLWDKLCENFSSDHILIDEASASFVRREYLQAALALVAMIRVKNAQKIAWLAFDPQWYDKNSLTDLRNILKKADISVSFLHNVMRSSQEVYDYCHAEVSDTNKLSKLGMSQVRLGHKIQGIQPIFYENHFAHARQAALHLFKVALPDILQDLNLLDLPPNSIGVVVFGKVMSHHIAMTEIPNLFARFCHPSMAADFPAPMVANLEESAMYLREASDHHPMPKNWPSNMKDVFAQVQLEPGMDFPVVGSPGVVCASTQALSLEWPLVIILSIIPKTAHQPHTSLQRYLARSRAIVTFIEVFYTFDRGFKTKHAEHHLKYIRDYGKGCSCDYCNQST